MNEKQVTEKKVGIVAYLSLAFAIVFFSGIFANSTNWLGIFDFTVLVGAFGSILTDSAVNFKGVGGTGAREGFMFALTIIPSVMFALGIVAVVEHLGALEAAKKLLTPILKPLLGIPGIAGLSLITSLQNTDAGASMTKILYDNKEITDNQRSIFAAFQFSGGGTIVNYFSTGAALFALTNLDKTPAIVVPMIVPLALIFVMKIFGANLMRFYLKANSKRENKDERSVA